MLLADGASIIGLTGCRDRCRAEPCCVGSLASWVGRKGTAQSHAILSNFEFGEWEAARNARELPLTSDIFSPSSASALNCRAVSLHLLCPSTIPTGVAAHHIPHDAFPSASARQSLRFPPPIHSTTTATRRTLDWRTSIPRRPSAPSPLKAEPSSAQHPHGLQQYNSNPPSPPHPSALAIVSRPSLPPPSPLHRRQAHPARQPRPFHPGVLRPDPSCSPPATIQQLPLRSHHPSPPKASPLCIASLTRPHKPCPPPPTTAQQLARADSLRRPGPPSTLPGQTRTMRQSTSRSLQTTFSLSNAVPIKPSPPTHPSTPSSVIFPPHPPQPLALRP